MTKDKLEKLYQIMANSTELGVALSDDVLSQINTLEENIIKEEVLPLLNEQIEPTLRAVKRNLVLVIDYDPEGTIRVNLSRRANVVDEIKDAKEIKPDEHPIHKSRGKQNNPSLKKAKASKLVINMDNGTKIANDSASNILAEFVRRVGWEKVRDLGLKKDNGPFVTNNPDNRYGGAFQEVAKGWYVNTHMNNKDKVRIIEKIAKQLGIKVKVEIL